ncbi:hypothetical protein K501DRAFT_276150 [Backusella circina FSU 941]|nr:hypothetical protein K501DRAFT_276150 [Backusella circina FSU 941]
MIKLFRNNFEISGDGIPVAEEEVQMAKENDRKSLYDIGTLYYDNNKYIRVLQWYLKAAGVVQKAINWFQKASECNHGNVNNFVKELNEQGFYANDGDDDGEGDLKNSARTLEKEFQLKFRQLEYGTEELRKQKDKDNERLELYKLTINDSADPNYNSPNIDECKNDMC